MISLDRPTIAEHFVFEFREFDRHKAALRIEQDDLTVTTGDKFVDAALNPGNGIDVRKC
ncbi:hypothetical protein [Streptomyces coeruleofuscus]|uniref:hypothetical protein n=1 Tax=Streptomyces coeruleofuscus TaxID=66879 RepID=UPI0031F8857E